MSAFGAIKEGTNLEDYDTKYSFFRAAGARGLGITLGTLLIGGVGYAGYKYQKDKKQKDKPAKKPKKEK